MITIAENKIKVIQNTDPELPEYLDFQQLRKEGLEHLGKLSGKIWTDHNMHDPGVTILEVLCYAIMDLGYRVNLPIEDLLQQNPAENQEPNFFTPLEILTVNPVTVLDYRKLFLEIKGVQNAWLEIAENLKLGIYQNDNILTCNPELTGVFECSNPDKPLEDYGQIHLNGVYNVYLELEKNADEDFVRTRARALYNEHRNLCEDIQ